MQANLLCLFAILSLVFHTAGNTNELAAEAIAKAMASVENARARAEADPSKPVFHITAPANWINDPNGAVFHGGYYHIFYQHNPYGDKWGHMHWGHVRSRDLVKWERLPIALWPSLEAGEEHVFSGCATTNALGQPLVFYTSIKKGKSATDFAEQWAAIGDPGLITWQKHPANPVLAETLHGSTKVYDWRDPFVFHHQGRTLMVLGGNLNRAKGGQAVVTLYEATNQELTKWKYQGVLFTHPDTKVNNIECPNFFPLNGKFVLVVSPHGKVEYFVGDFDARNHSFKWDKRGLIDGSSTYYAPNCMLDPQGRRIMWGWLRGFKEGLGWNGCLSLPRILKIDAEGNLFQSPAPELSNLRTNEMPLGEIPLESGTNSVTGDTAHTIEFSAELECVNPKGFVLRVIRHASPKDAINFTAEELEITPGTNRLRAFVDRSVVEVFANDRKCVSRILPGFGAPELLVITRDGNASLRNMVLWQMGSIW
ncbi:MAG: glycoside hydrolase family 32 protein [Verrucomicrobia subdivision 3 bacterium]|nr:glycoside hydrolase family 32 protein [Limisphaerales bacterium]